MYILIAILAVYSVLLTYNVCQLKTRVDLYNKKFDLLYELQKSQEELQDSTNASIIKMIKSINVDIAKTNEKIDEVNKDLLNHSQYLKDLDDDLAITKDQLQEVQSRLDILAKLRLYKEPEEDTDVDDVVTENSIKDMDEIWNGMAFLDDEGNIRYPTTGGKEKIAKWVNEHPTDIDFEKDVDEHGDGM